MRSGRLGAERPSGQGGQLDAEHGAGILECGRHRAGNTLVDHGPAGLPVEAAHGGQEDRQRLLVVASSERLEGRPPLLQERPGPGQCEERRLQEHEGVHHLGTVQGHLQGDDGAAGVADDVRPRHVEVLEQRGRVNHVIGDARPGGEVCVLPAQPRLWYRIRR